ncbi:hypothetical protein BRYFOR_05881 [Marvinbryantia formatexigens DSM 14469]|uniref:Uncharacterized protein n=1 Tax=Marvinbryantia formatexigens DSM 14469 TaxID=478749 RepID=C6LB86_9FIRM|nr:hypothetical protein BRYFOR_05881 [Marvinbryantia formatexigens DSM 14469]
MSRRLDVSGYRRRLVKGKHAERCSTWGCILGHRANSHMTVIRG